MFSNIQVLQAAAAYCVVAVHLVDSWNNYTGEHFGYPLHIPGGFNSLFFVISGFVIAKSTKSHNVRPRQFLTRRIVRIVPLYWALTCIVFTSTLFGLRTLGLNAPDMNRFFLSLVFLPAFENGEPVSPILFVGWTLNFQVFFYLLFALSLTLRPIMSEEIAFAACVIVISAASYFVDWPELAYFSDEILLAFLFGILLSRIQFNNLQSTRWLGPRVFALVLTTGVISLLGVALFLTGPLLEHQHGFLAVASALILFGAIGLEQQGKVVRSKFILRQGAASYSVFLLHPLILQLTGKAMILSGLNATVPGTLFGYLGTLLAVGAAGTMVHTRIERPLHEALKPTSPVQAVNTA